MSKLGLQTSYDLAESITCVDVSQDYYAAGLLDESVSFWKGAVSKDNEPSRLEGHSLGIIDIKFMKHYLAVSSLDSVLRVWDLEKSIKLKEIQCDQMDNWKICWYKEYLCTAGEGGRVSMFDLKGEQEFQPFSVEKSFATCIASNNKCIAVGTDSGSLHVVESLMDKNKLHPMPKLHRKMVRSVKFSNDGYKSYTASDDCTIKLVDLQKMKAIKTFNGHGMQVNSIDVNPVDDRLLVSCSHDYTVRLWDTVSGLCIEQFQPFDKKDDKLWDVKFSADGQLVAVCSQYGQLGFYQRN